MKKFKRFAVATPANMLPPEQLLANQVKEKARAVRVTPIMEDLAEMKLSSCKKVSKDDSTLLHRSR